jgi:hypothetical protein
MRTFGILVILIGLSTAIWCTATHVMRRTYFRPVASLAGVNEVYSISVECGDRLDVALYVPAIIASAALTVSGVVVLRAARSR